MRKPNSNAILKNQPAEVQAEIYALFQADGEREAMSLADAAGWITSRFGLAVSRSSLGEWLSWYRMKLDGERAAALAEQAKLYFLKEYPEATPEDLERFAQLKFYADQMGPDANGKLFVQMFKARTDREKLAEATRSKVRAGLESLRAEIAGNPQALKIWKQLEEIVAKG